LRLIPQVWIFPWMNSNKNPLWKGVNLTGSSVLGIKAAELVNQWADQAFQELSDASHHALRAEELSIYLDSIETCLQRTTLGSDAKAPCSFPNLPIILEEIQKTGEIVYQEKEASRGLMPALSINIVEKSQVPRSSVVFNRNAFVLAGSFIGLLFGILFTFLWGNKPKIKRLRG
jgi:hypothetical protein